MKSDVTRWVLGVGLYTVLTAGGAAAQAPETKPTDGDKAGEEKARAAGVMSTADLLRTLHHRNQMEIELAKMAKTKSQSKLVKDFANELIRDHQQADSRVMAYAREHDLLPAVKATEGLKKKTMKKGEEAQQRQQMGQAGMDDQEKMAEMMAEKKATVSRLQGLSGKAFDRELLATILEHHEKGIAMVEKARGEVPDQELRKLLGDTLTALEKHRTKASELLQEVRRTEEPAGG